MASIKERNGSYQITVSCGRDIYGKKLIETTTYTPDPALTPKKRQKAVEEFARQFESDVKNGIEYTVGDYERTKEIPEQIRVLFNLAIYGGLRKGELLALEWSDIDFDNDTVTVSKAVSVVAGQQITKEPKTKTSRRTDAIPHFLTQRIKQLKHDRLKYRLSLGDYWQGADWLFIQENGKQMSYSTPYSAFQDTIARYNAGKEADKQLTAIPFHGLRHTSATLLIASKQDVRTVSSRLGHAQASTTMNIYAHALQETDRKAANALENMLVKHA